MKELIRIIKFILISASAGIIQTLSFALMNEVAKWDYWLSYLIALLLSVLWNFTINRKATFRTDANYGIAMLKVLGYYCVFTPISVLGGNALEGIGWNEYLVLFLSMVINMSTEFLFMRYVVYRDKVDNAINQSTVNDTILQSKSDGTLSQPISNSTSVPTNGEQSD